MCVCACSLGKVLLWRSENITKASVLFFDCVCPGDWTWVIRMDSRHRDLLSCLSDSLLSAWWNQVVHSLYEWVCVAGLFHLTQWSPSCLKWRASILGLTIRPWWVNTFALIVLSCQTFSVGSQSWLFWVVLWWGWEYGCLFCLVSSVASLYLLKGQQLTETASRAGHCANLGLGMPYTLP